jgi:hypothetical protein
MLQDKNHHNVMGKTYFILCELCYWCASMMGMDYGLISKCPMCNDGGRIESIILSNESAKSFDSSI